MLQLLIGFAIAVVIALTGVGAGVVTAPLLILFLHVPVEIAVSTALAYAAVVKLIVVPVQIWRKQVSYRILLWMLLGGIPGVILGSLIFRHVAQHGPKALLYIVLGSIIIFSSGWQIFRHFRPDAIARPTTDRPKWIAFITFPIAAEVGFSSSGAGALGTVALLGLTSLSAAQVVGTDLTFGLALSVVGTGVHMISGDLRRSVVVEAGDRRSLWRACRQRGGPTHSQPAAALRALSVADGHRVPVCLSSSLRGPVKTADPSCCGAGDTTHSTRLFGAGYKMGGIMKILTGEKRGCRKGPETWFTGTVWLNEIVNPAAPSRLKANHVWFGPGSRTAWHTHPVGQTLHVLDGLGLVQLAGEPPQVIRPGDTILIAPRNVIGTAQRQDGRWLTSLCRRPTSTVSMWSGSSMSRTRSTRLFDRSVLGGDMPGLLRALHRIAILTLLPWRAIKLGAVILL